MMRMLLLHARLEGPQSLDDNSTATLAVPPLHIVMRSRCRCRSDVC
jgi:hypothetical protein